MTKEGTGQPFSLHGGAGSRLHITACPLRSSFVGIAMIPRDMNEVRLMRTPEKTRFTPAHYCVPVFLRNAVVTKKKKAKSKTNKVESIR